MGAGAIAVLMAVAVGCDDDTTIAATTAPAPSPSPATSAPSAASSARSTNPPTATTPPVPSTTLDDGCSAPPPDTYPSSFTPATMVFTNDPVSVEIDVTPREICSGGSTTFTITLHNGLARDYPIPGLWLIMLGSGFNRWSVASLPGVVVPAKGEITVQHAGPIPPCPPGGYAVAVYGFSGGATIRVNAPTGA